MHTFKKYFYSLITGNTQNYVTEVCTYLYSLAVFDRKVGENNFLKLPNFLALCLSLHCKLPVFINTFSFRVMEDNCGDVTTKIVISVRTK